MSTNNDGPLTTVDANDLGLASSFRASNPLEFSALDGNGQALLYITGTTGKPLEISIKNVSNVGYTLPKIASKPSPTQYHLAIRFRPGTLSSQTIKGLAIDQKGWSFQVVTEKSGLQIIYVLCNVGLELDATKTETFTFSNISAGSTMGAHSTKVEFSYANLTPTSGSPLSGTVSTIMQVINAEGIDASPFYFGVAGSNTILNNNTANTLSFIVGTAGNQPVNISANSQLILSFAAGTIAERPWAISTANELTIIKGNNVKISGGNSGEWKFKESKPLGDNIDFYFTFKDQTVLSNDNPVEIVLEGLKTTHPNGLTPVTLRYINIHGYWDGAIQAWLCKGPVGVGRTAGVIKNTPPAALEVDGDIEVLGDIYTNQLSGFPLANGTTSMLLFGGFKAEDTKEWPYVKWLQENINWKNPYTGTGYKDQWDEGLIKIDSLASHFGRGGFGLHQHATKEFGFYSSGWVPLLISEGSTGNTYIKGNLGIGVAKGSPKESSPKLEVNGNAVVEGNLLVNGLAQVDYPSKMTNGMLIGNPQSNNAAGLFVSVPTGGGAVSPFQICKEGRVPYFLVDSEGKVGIGRISTTKAQLCITAGPSYTITGKKYAWLAAGGKLPVGWWSDNSTADFSIWADGRIAALEFDAMSDIRIKDIRGISNSTQDLETLSKILITDYQYVDFIQNGTKSQKKVIGQQIAEVFPQAVTKHTDVVPDIFKKGQIVDGTIHVEGEEFQRGDRVKVIFEDDSSEILEVQETCDKGAIVETDKLGDAFIYGREVDDFHNVDYDAISMLNVSATQQLHKLVKEQAQLIKEQGDMIQALREEMEASRKDLQKVMSLVKEKDLQ